MRATYPFRPKTIAQEGGIALIDLVEASDRRSCIGKGFRRDALRDQDAQCRAHVLNGISGWAPIDADSDLLNILPVDLKIEARRIDQLTGSLPDGWTYGRKCRRDWAPRARRFFARSELLTSEFQPVTSFWGPPPRKRGIDFWGLVSLSVQ